MHGLHGKKRHPLVALLALPPPDGAVVMGRYQTVVGYLRKVVLPQVGSWWSRNRSGAVALGIIRAEEGVVVLLVTSQ
jgi:hypothetical protein